MLVEKLVIKGGNRLKGEVKVSGAKNAALKLMAASILSNDEVVLKNIPKIKDVFLMVKVLEELGMGVNLDDSGKATIVPANPLKHEASYELVNQMRASIIVLGPLLAKVGRARVALPGGCKIGLRKIDFHLRGLEKLGAKINVEHGFIEAEADVLKGADVSFDFPSVGATENVLMAAVKAKGTTVIENAAREPEITDLVCFLKQMGAKIEGTGTSTLIIDGVDKLGASKEYSVVSDRIEAGTFMVAVALAGGEILIKNAPLDFMGIVLEKLTGAGIKIDETADGLHVSRDEEIKPLDVVTLPYPGFPTDMQAQIITLLSLAGGTSIVTENVFENRFMLIDELNRMGANIRVQGPHAIIKGVEKFFGASVRATDLRGGAALVLAGLAAKGITEVIDISHIDRGYSNLDTKFRALGANIFRTGERDSLKD
ncbi:MAG TPA: UDP-N-acetylglucosamine 1-carboxyvinyltransferase [Actinobacteria bacterium]|nr:UDP-N-acetylglucosamine 1-carboxyvinyltransferase [Actinomycetota bacterium]